LIESMKLIAALQLD